MQDLNLSLVQTSLVWENPEANLDHFTKMLETSGNPSDLVILPEMFNTGFTMNAAKNAEDMSGPSLQWMADTASKKNCVLCGSLIILDQGKYFNRFIWMRPDGSHEHYDKKHLFRMGNEHRHFSAGNKKLITELKGWKVMPLICYDLRFPLWSKNEFIDDDYAYNLLIYVANWPAARIQAWSSLITGRAIENMAYTAGVNRVGTDGRGYEYNGSSLVVAPDGHSVSRIPPDKEVVTNILIKAAPMLELREKLGVGKDWDKFELI